MTSPGNARKYSDISYSLSRRTFVEAVQMSHLLWSQLEIVDFQV